MFGRCIRWVKRWDPRSPRPIPLVTTTPPTIAAKVQSLTADLTKKSVECRASKDGWLRILRAEDLLELVQGAKAMDAMWRQSRLSATVWQRDLLPAVHRYAEYVQLMPASESHHHAHVGGLLAHTLEMTLAAMTWRNGHFFPEAAPVEEVDAQRDEWTYVVFFAALMHDIGKIMTDLRVSWSCQDMDAPLRWVPMSGPLTEMSQCRPGGQYLVEFTPKSARDYQAHTRLSMILLQQIAPASALSFLARRPQAFESFAQYLSGSDKTSLLATLIRRADQTSTQHALSSGSRARFATSSSVPLIDLLMQSIKDMLRSGTTLPLNRSGAAGWVYDGAIWFVAKRLADGVRQHVKQHYPEESVPGENKNDRLFDTWQEYGCIQPNPQTGQAVWYVQVHGGESGSATEGEGAQGAPGGAEEVDEAEEGGATYSHTLTMLRFPLHKLFSEEAQYPPAMIGRIEVQHKRVANATGQQNGAITSTSDTHTTKDSTAKQASDNEDPKDGSESTAHKVDANPGTTSPSLKAAKNAIKDKAALVLRAPAFSRPKAATSKPEKAIGQSHSVKSTAVPTHQGPKPDAPNFEPLQLGGPDGFGKWLDFEDDAAVLKRPPKQPPQAGAVQPSKGVPPVQTPAPNPARSPKAATTPAPAQKIEAQKSPPELPPIPEPPDRRPLLVRAGQPSISARTNPGAAFRMQHAPVVLTPFLPELPHETAGKQTEPTSTAMAFVTWLQQGLASRALKYNETGAMIHFTAEGMALVSPAVFKAYVAEQDTVNDSEAESQALQVQREVIKAGWHLMGPGKTNILKYQVLGRGGVPVGKLSAVVLIRPERWVMPVPPSNPVLQIA